MRILSFFKPQTIAIFHSDFNGEIKVTESFGKKMIIVDGAEQSGGTIVPMWRESIGKMHDLVPRIESCLLLGLAGATVIPQLKKYYPSIRITGVEIDPVMIAIARNYFPENVPDGTSIRNEDAFQFLRKKVAARYDLVVVDLYIGKLNPASAQVKAFLMRLKEYLKERGQVLFNRHYQEDEADYRVFLSNCRTTYQRVTELLAPPYSRILLLR